jgi:hypothetical protein
MARVNQLGAVVCVGLAWASLAAIGCSGTGDGSRVGELIGRALAPGDGEPVPLADDTVVLLTYDDEGNLVMAEVGTTDENGEFKVDVETQAVVALVVNGTTDDGMTDISGLFNPEAGIRFEKVLDAATSIACVAGLSAIGDGSIAAEQLNEARVQNLEDASEDYIADNPDFDYYDASDRMDAVDAVRNSTNDGANPAP